MPLSKEELRAELTKRNIAFTEDDNVDELKKKLDLASMVTTKDETLPYVLMDDEDENQILEEIQGAVLNTYVYSFEQTVDGQTKRVVGLSKAGVDQICRERTNRGELYRTIEQEVIDEGEYYRVIVKAGRYTLLRNDKNEVTGEQLMDTAIGSKRQWKKMTLRGGKVVDNKFAFEVAVSKAQRNAKKALLPYKFIEEMVKKYQEQGNVKTIRADRNITEKQLKFLHQIGSEVGLGHDKLTALIKGKFGYESVTALQMVQMDEAVALIKTSAVVKVAMPYDVKKAFGNIGFTEAKAQIWWTRALELGDNDVVKATTVVLAQIKKEEVRLEAERNK